MMLFFATFVTALILSFNAVADIDAFRIVGAEVSARDAEVSGDVVSYDADSIESDTVFHHVGDTITYNLSVKNQHSKNYKIITISDDNSNPNVSYTYDRHAGEEVAGGASFNLEVVAEYVTGVSSLNDRDQHLAVRFTITYEDTADPGPEPTPEPTPSDAGETDNPNTGDRLPVYVAILILSAIGFIICVWCAGESRDDGRKKNYNGRKLIISLLVLSSLIPVAAKALTESSDFVLTTDYRFMDKLAITMDIDGDESVTPIAYGATVSTLSTPSKANFEFIGWETEDGDPIPGSTKLTEDTKVVAKFERVSINAHFIHNNGTADETVVEVPINSTLGDRIPAGPTYTSHVFNNWYTAADGGSLIDANTQVAESDVAYYAHWLNDISAATANPDTMELFIDIDAEKTQTFEIIGVNLEGYTIESSDENVATVSGNAVTAAGEGTTEIVIVGTGSGAEKTVITVTVAKGMRDVTFVHNNGTQDTTVKTVRANTALGSENIPSAPTYAGHLFDGWFDSDNNQATASTTITDDITFTAHWSADVTNATATPSTMTLYYDIPSEATGPFTISGTDENYTVASSDTNVATVANGTVTAVGAGTANIIITGARSTEQQTVITVTVYRGMRDVTFVHNNGTQDTTV
ncbi:MAG: InlB B-repeat-containing protein, partial [Candidatus Saccharibacteria bacterium]|nr:InlB B-repeat-containing protein [Candidatus Saccharibacteria bacterium]